MLLDRCSELDFLRRRCFLVCSYLTVSFRVHVCCSIDKLCHFWQWCSLCMAVAHLTVPLRLESLSRSLVFRNGLARSSKPCNSYSQRNRWLCAMLWLLFDWHGHALRTTACFLSATILSESHGFAHTFNQAMLLLLYRTLRCSQHHWRWWCLHLSLVRQRRRISFSSSI